MRLIYGARFQQTYGAEPNPLWLDAIRDLTDDECRAGFKRLRESGDGWPPSLPAFVQACKPRGAGVRFLGVPQSAADRDALLALEAPRDPEARDRAIANMKRNVRGAQ